MHTGFWGSWFFRLKLTVLMLTPPLYSFQRLEEFLKKEIRRHPTAYLPRMSLANLYKDYSKNQDAKREFLELERLGCMTDNDRLDYGQVLYRLEDFTGVVQVVVPVIDRFPRVKNANWYLGASYEKEGQFEKAAEYIQKAIHAGLGSYETYWHLGYCYHRLGRFELAVEAYERAYRIRSDSVELRKAIALACVEMGRSLLAKDTKQATHQFKKALRFDPADQEARRALTGLGSLPREPGCMGATGQDGDEE